MKFGTRKNGKKNWKELSITLTEDDSNDSWDKYYKKPPQQGQLPSGTTKGKSPSPPVTVVDHLVENVNDGERDAVKHSFRPALMSDKRNVDSTETIVGKAKCSSGLFTSTPSVKHKKLPEFEVSAIVSPIDETGRQQEESISLTDTNKSLRVNRVNPTVSSDDRFEKLLNSRSTADNHGVPTLSELRPVNSMKNQADTTRHYAGGILKGRRNCNSNISQLMEETENNWVTTEEATTTTKVNPKSKVDSPAKLREQNTCQKAVPQTSSKEEATANNDVQYQPKAGQENVIQIGNTGEMACFRSDIAFQIGRHCFKQTNCFGVSLDLFKKNNPSGKRNLPALENVVSATCPEQVLVPGIDPPERTTNQEYIPSQLPNSCATAPIAPQATQTGESDSNQPTAHKPAKPKHEKVKLPNEGDQGCQDQMPVRNDSSNKPENAIKFHIERDIKLQQRQSVRLTKLPCKNNLAKEQDPDLSCSGNVRKTLSKPKPTSLSSDVPAYKDSKLLASSSVPNKKYDCIVKEPYQGSKSPLRTQICEEAEKNNLHSNGETSKGKVSPLKGPSKLLPKEIDLHPNEEKEKVSSVKSPSKELPEKINLHANEDTHKEKVSLSTDPSKQLSCAKNLEVNQSSLMKDSEALFPQSSELNKKNANIQTVDSTKRTGKVDSNMSIPKELPKVIEDPKVSSSSPAHGANRESTKSKQPTANSSEKNSCKETIAYTKKVVGSGQKLSSVSNILLKQQEESKDSSSEEEKKLLRSQSIKLRENKSQSLRNFRVEHCSTILERSVISKRTEIVTSRSPVKTSDERIREIQLHKKGMQPLVPTIEKPSQEHHHFSNTAVPTGEPNVVASNLSSSEEEVYLARDPVDIPEVCQDDFELEIMSSSDDDINVFRKIRKPPPKPDVKKRIEKKLQVTPSKSPYRSKKLKQIRKRREEQIRLRTLSRSESSEDDQKLSCSSKGKEKRNVRDHTDKNDKQLILEAVYNKTAKKTELDTHKKSVNVGERPRQSKPKAKREKAHELVSRVESKGEQDRGLDGVSQRGCKRPLREQNLNHNVIPSKKVAERKCFQTDALPTDQPFELVQNPVEVPDRLTVEGESCEQESSNQETNQWGKDKELIVMSPLVETEGGLAQQSGVSANNHDGEHIDMRRSKRQPAPPRNYWISRPTSSHFQCIDPLFHPDKVEKKRKDVEGLESGPFELNKRLKENNTKQPAAAKINNRGSVKRKRNVLIYDGADVLKGNDTTKSLYERDQFVETTCVSGSGLSGSLLSLSVGAKIEKTEMNYKMMYYVLEGQINLESAQEGTRQLAAGSFFIVPKGKFQHMENKSDSIVKLVLTRVKA